MNLLAIKLPEAAMQKGHLLSAKNEMKFDFIYLVCKFVGKYADDDIFSF